MNGVSYTNCLQLTYLQRDVRASLPKEVGTTIGDIGIWKVGSWEKLVLKNSKVNYLSAVSISQQEYGKLVHGKNWLSRNLKLTISVQLYTLIMEEVPNVDMDASKGENVLEEISNIGFSEHYFNFAAYNELSDRATARNPNPNGYTVQTTYSGTTIGFTLWNWRKILMYLSMTQWRSQSSLLSVHAISIVTTLSGTSATHYYLNPNIPETYQIRQLRPDFVLDEVFKNPILALPPPFPAKAPAPQMLPEPHQTSPYSLTTPERKNRYTFVHHDNAIAVIPTFVIYRK
ncbi:hypothetical protein Tco_1096057 [Tanacetum coccineum]